jgi:hypothetical protein
MGGILGSGHESGMLPRAVTSGDCSRKRLRGWSVRITGNFGPLAIGVRVMRPALDRFIDLIRLSEQGSAIELGPRYEREALPWFRLIRDVGFLDIDARMSFEKAAAIVRRPNAGEPLSLSPVLESLQAEARATVRQMTEAERLVGLMYWMYVRQRKAETRRIAATFDELARELGVDAAVAARLVARGRDLNLVTYYRQPRPGKPDYYCLSAEGLAKVPDPWAVLQALGPEEGNPGRLAPAGSTAPGESATMRPVTNADVLDIFVSHSARDADIVQLLVVLLRSALNLPAATIRCTSVDGYRLPAGADTNAQLRQEVNNCNVLLGVISA